MGMDDTVQGHADESRSERGEIGSKQAVLQRVLHGNLAVRVVMERTRLVTAELRPPTLVGRHHHTGLGREEATNGGVWTECRRQPFHRRGTPICVPDLERGRRDGTVIRQTSFLDEFPLCESLGQGDTRQRGEFHRTQGRSPVGTVRGDRRSWFGRFRFRDLRGVRRKQTPSRARSHTNESAVLFQILDQQIYEMSVRYTEKAFHVVLQAYGVRADEFFDLRYDATCDLVSGDLWNPPLQAWYRLHDPPHFVEPVLISDERHSGSALLQFDEAGGRQEWVGSNAFAEPPWERRKALADVACGGLVVTLQESAIEPDECLKIGVVRGALRCSVGSASARERGRGCEFRLRV